MQTIRRTDEAKSFIDGLKKADDIVVLVGSFISVYPPTCLFSGTQFVEEVFTFLFPQDFFDSSSEEQRILEEFFNHVPFEHLLERYPNREKLIRVFKKAYFIKKFNPLHKLLADLLINGKIKALITPNYDLCLDEALSKCSNRFLRIVTKNDFDINKNNIPNINIYFKIHGSADDNEGETLVLTLTQESILPEWKREVLYQILNGRALVITGYSGKDFEICPELERMDFKQIIWNTKNEALPSKNAERLLTKRNGIQLIMDMKELLSELF